MFRLVVLVLYEPNKLDQVLDAWEATGVTEHIAGTLIEPEAGILFVIPLLQVWGSNCATPHQ